MSPIIQSTFAHADIEIRVKSTKIQSVWFKDVEYKGSTLPEGLWVDLNQESISINDPNSGENLLLDLSLRSVIGWHIIEQNTIELQNDGGDCALRVVFHEFDGLSKVTALLQERVKANFIISGDHSGPVIVPDISSSHISRSNLPNIAQPSPPPLPSSSSSAMVVQQSPAREVFNVVPTTNFRGHRNRDISVKGFKDPRSLANKDDSLGAMQSLAQSLDVVVSSYTHKIRRRLAKCVKRYSKTRRYKFLMLRHYFRRSLEDLATVLLDLPARELGEELGNQEPNFKLEMTSTKTIIESMQIPKLILPAIEDCLVPKQ